MVHDDLLAVTCEDQFEEEVRYFALYDPKARVSAECLVVQLDSHAAGELSSVERGAG